MTAISVTFLFFSAALCGHWTLPSALVSGEERVATNEPKFISEGKHISVKEGQTIELECLVEDLGEFVILWKFNRTQVLFAGNLRIHRDDQISRNDQTGALLIKNFRAENSGEYSCQVSTNPPKDIAYDVHILGPPHIKSDTSQEIVVRKGDPIVMECVVSGDLQWTHNSQLLPYTQQHLNIESATPQHSGQYTCTASNDIGQSSRGFRVRVLYSPELETSSPVIHAPIGQPLRIECIVSAEPSANVNWYKSGNTKVLPTSGIIIDRKNSSASVSFDSISESDFDEYACVANNSLGSKQLKISVTGRPSIPQISSPPLGGRQSSYRLEFSLDSESPITEYVVQWKRSTEDNWHSMKVSPEEGTTGLTKWQSVDVNDLDVDQNYDVIVSAQNKYGSTQSPLFSFVTSIGATHAQSMAVVVVLLMALCCK